MKKESKSESVFYPVVPTASANRSSLFATTKQNTSAANGSTSSIIYPIDYLKPSEPKPAVPAETGSVMYNVNAPGVSKIIIPKSV